jgi:hypothetical protein
VLGRIHPQIVIQLAVDVLQASRNRPHPTIDGERETDSMARCRVRVLADDQEPGIRHRIRERPQDVGARREIPAPGRDLGPEEIAEPRDVRRDRLERVRPLRVDEFPQRPGGVHAPKPSER